MASHTSNTGKFRNDKNVGRAIDIKYSYAQTIDLL